MDINDLGILVLTTPSQFRFIKSCLESYKKIDPKMIVCVVEIPLNPRDINNFIPHKDIINLGDTWLFLNAYHARSSWVWLCRYGLSILRNSNIKYIMSTEGDCIIEKPEGIHDLFNTMVSQECDIIGGYKDGREIATVTFLTESIKAMEISDAMTGELLKHSVNRVELAHGMAVRRLGYKCATVKNPAHMAFHVTGDNTWSEILGFRHLHGEEYNLRKNGKDALNIFPQYYDQRYIRRKIF